MLFENVKFNIIIINFLDIVFAFSNNTNFLEKNMKAHHTLILFSSDYD